MPRELPPESMPISDSPLRRMTVSLKGVIDAEVEPPAALLAYDTENEPSLDGLTFRQAKSMAAKLDLDESAAATAWENLAELSVERNKLPIGQPGGPFMFGPAAPVTVVRKGAASSESKTDSIEHIKSAWVLADETYRVVRSWLDEPNEDSEPPVHSEPESLAVLVGLLNERIELVHEHGSAMPVWRKNLTRYDSQN